METTSGSIINLGVRDMDLTKHTTLKIDFYLFILFKYISSLFFSYS